jgi:P-type E1-E2 ATPase
MIEVTIPGWGELRLQYAVLDVNGTLALDGVLVDGVAERLTALRPQLDVRLLTADTHGGQAAIDARLGLTAERLAPGQEREQKAAYVGKLGAAQTVAIGNGNNDAGMLATAGLGIAVMGREGLSVEAMQSADIVVASILDGLDLLLRPKRLIATLRR